MAFIAFIVWEFRVKDPLVNLRILKSRNFTIGLMLMTVIGIILYGTTAELPLFLQTLMGYPALQSGYTMSPRGVAAFFTTFLVGRLVGQIPLRCMLCFGFAMLSLSSYMLSGINLQVSMASVILPTVLNGVAISFIFVPLTTATMSQLRQQEIGSGTGLYNLMLQSRRQHRHRVRHHAGRARRAGASGAHGRAFDADRPGVRPTTSCRPGRARPA